MKRIFKYGTGEAPPEGAVYLSTVVQTKAPDDRRMKYNDCWYVWHYFLVEVER